MTLSPLKSRPPPHPPPQASNTACQAGTGCHQPSRGGGEGRRGEGGGDGNSQGVPIIPIPYGTGTVRTKPRTTYPLYSNNGPQTDTLRRSALFSSVEASHHLIPCGRVHSVWKPADMNIISLVSKYPILVPVPINERTLPYLSLYKNLIKTYWAIFANFTGFFF